MRRLERPANRRSNFFWPSEKSPYSQPVRRYGDPRLAIVTVEIQPDAKQEVIPYKQCHHNRVNIIVLILQRHKLLTKKKKFNANRCRRCEEKNL